MDTPVSHTYTQDTRKCLLKSPVDAMQECDLPGYVTPEKIKRETDSSILSWSLNYGEQKTILPETS